MGEILMRALQSAGCGLALMGILLLQGCGGGSGKDTSAASSSVASSFSSFSSSSVASVSSVSSSSAVSVSAAEAHLGADNLPPDSGVLAARTLAAEDLSPELSPATSAASRLGAEALPPL